MYDDLSCKFWLNNFERDINHVLCGVGTAYSSSQFRYQQKCGIFFVDSGSPLYEIWNGNAFLLRIEECYSSILAEEKVSLFSNFPIVSWSSLKDVKYGHDPYSRKLEL